MRTLLALVALGLFALPASALERGRDGYFHTGDGIRYKKIAFINIKVYSIDHYMKDLPQQKSKQAVIDANVDKRISWKMLRTVEADKIKNALREAYAKNGYGDAAKINSFVDSITKELKQGDNVTIKYDAGTKATTITSPAGSATVAGEDFMKATWSIWFGKIDQKDLGDSLLKDF
jgi:chalcone isomerase-like protein